ncbi:hypothetical protein [Fodinibius salsisoli]|uniref:Uncharacterized protein n=1 Tax=Fodinibius salsisoli TaxID=2820877 RepID=A0ABT3PQM2_9BACT|nr:hypothetical protein [Fodinibius salsisoli]MCW9708169.1 hypothetical protein [Fodinibius salsisoli]
MKLLGNILAFIVAAGILVAIGWGGYIGITFLVKQYEIINPQFAAVLIISSVILLVSALIIASAIRNQDKGSDKQIHPEKAVLYSRFMESWYAGNHEDRREKLKELEKHMIIWASDDVLQEYLKLNELLREEKGNPQLVAKVKDIVIAIREDLGAENKDIDIEKLQKLFSFNNPIEQDLEKNTEFSR